VPVKWVINGEQLTSCNNALVVPSLNIEKKLESGQNIINFTPRDKDINFSCWMGMISGVIKVVDDVNAIDSSKEAGSVPPANTGGSCCSPGGVE
jgi:plastocyanin domain-containing protein